MKGFTHPLAVWSGILASVLGCAAAYESVHSDLSKQHQDATQAQQAESQQAAERQRRIDALNAHLDEIDKHLRFIDETLPKERQRIAREIFAQIREQQDVRFQGFEKMDRGEPVLAQRQMAPAAAAEMAVKPMAEAARKAAKSRKETPQ